MCWQFFSSSKVGTSQIRVAAILVLSPVVPKAPHKMSPEIQLTITPDTNSQHSIIREDSEDSNWPPDDVQPEKILQRTRFPGLRKNLRVIVVKIILNLGISLFDFGSDTKVGIDLRQGEFRIYSSGNNPSDTYGETQGYHPIWSSLTFILMFIPGAVIGVFVAF